MECRDLFWVDQHRIQLGTDRLPMRFQEVGPWKLRGFENGCIPDLRLSGEKAV